MLNDKLGFRVSGLVEILIEMGVMLIEVDELESERVKFIYCLLYTSRCV